MEGYSRESFDNNEKKIDEARDKAKLKPFGGRADPSDIMGAKWDYMAGKQERERLLNLAHDEALRENVARDKSEQKNKEENPISIKDRINLLDEISNTDFGNYSDADIEDLLVRSGISNDDIEFLIKTKNQRRELISNGIPLSLLTDQEKRREYDIEARLKSFLDREDQENFRENMRQEALKGEASEFFLNAIQPNEVLVLGTKSGNEYRIFLTSDGKIFVFDRKSNLNKKPEEHTGSYLDYSGGNDLVIKKGKSFSIGHGGKTSDIISIKLTKRK